MVYGTTNQPSLSFVAPQWPNSPTTQHIEKDSLGENGGGASLSPNNHQLIVKTVHQII